MRLEMQAAEHGVGVDVENGIGGLARIEGEQDGDQPADDMGVAVADEAQTRDAVVRTDSGGKPDLAHAALHLIGGASLRLRERLEFGAELGYRAIPGRP